MKSLSQIIIVFLFACILSFPQNANFKSYTAEDGLSSSDVNCLLQDKVGFLWIGTENGLNRFDGVGFKIFRNRQNNSNSISDNSVWSLYEDRNGFIWIGTKSGVLNKYSPETEKFEQIKFVDHSLSQNSITAILEDKAGMIWLGTYSQGLFRYDPVTGKIKNWKYDPGLKSTLSNNYITSLLQDNNGFIWISTYNGLNKINPERLSDGFQVFLSENNNTNSLSNNLIWKINQSVVDKNLLWIGTANGLCNFDIQKQRFTQISVKVSVPLQFCNSFASIAEQNVNGNNILWAATYGGLFRIDLTNNNTVQYISDKKNSNGLLGNQIDQLLIDNSDVLWIATDKGLNYHSLKAQKFNNILSGNINSPAFQELLSSDVKAIIGGDNENYYIAASEGLFLLNLKNQKPELKKYDELNNLNLWSLTKGVNNDLWIGTYGNGLIHYDLSSAKLKFIKIESPTFKTSAFNYIKSLHLSKNGMLWMGFWGGGLAAYNTLSGEYKIWIKDDYLKRSISYNDIWALYEDKLGRLWIGTNGGGLNLYVPQNGGEFINWKTNPNDSNAIISNSILSISEINSAKSDETILLVGTENGLSKVTIQNDIAAKYEPKLIFNNFNDFEALIDKSINGIVKDDNGFLWISGSTGLMRINPLTKATTKFSISDGLLSNIFNSGSYFKSKNGLIFFGSSKGPLIFNPSEISLSKYQPNIILTDFELLNQSITPDDKSLLNKSITFTKQINLSHDQNVFTIKFSSTDFNESDQTQFLYKLDGFDKVWLTADKNRAAIYTNINPGSYTFKVKGTNSDGLWSDKEASVSIFISPPVWKTNWAYLLYVSVILVGLYVIRKFELSRTRLRNELRLKDLETKKIREIEIIKSRFFTNLSHEFRTPLMLIKGPVEQLLTANKIDRTEQVKLIQRNSEKLQNLIDQLLEISQLEAASIPLKAKKEDLVVIVRGILFSFAALAERKNIVLKFNSIKDEIIAWIDRDKLEKILNNLLSNAFKFTPENGFINIELVNTSIDNIDFTTISIKDSGIGIPEDKIDKIFDRFYQVDDSTKRAYSGSGIGLSLVKELVDLHEWKIFVHSKLESGTEFILQIPLGEKYLNDFQKVLFDSKSNDVIKTPSTISNSFEIVNEEPVESKNSQSINNRTVGNPKKSTILIVEDSEDVRIYLNDILKEEYNLILSDNGEKGITECLENLPDLIISDIMMPIMDGIEFCKIVKSDWKTSHIPVILLTAKASSESKIEGLETGADDYITKPFSFKELSIRIKNLLIQRRHLREKYSSDVIFKPENVTPNKADQEFLQNAVGVVEKNISNSDFDSEEFANQIFLSRSQLHRKIQSISGQSTGEFIRTIRLKKAAGLILENKFSITQIALEVGFNSPSHFTKAFKQMFECLPSEFIDRNNI
jgi:signal transduction histidine kinase/ligand-binding sensor domain-containing protein/DNA-binding response OmpR family regulator